MAGAGCVACAVAGVLGPPASAGAAAAFGGTFVVGQSLLYYLALLRDLMCFWAIRNSAVVAILAFTQNLLSGAYAALWYFPGWFRLGSQLLPFQYTIGIPLSFYVGRIPVADFPAQHPAAAEWVTALAILSRVLWHKAVKLLAAQGG